MRRVFELARQSRGPIQSSLIQRLQLGPQRGLSNRSDQASGNSSNNRAGSSSFGSNRGSGSGGGSDRRPGNSSFNRNVSGAGNPSAASIGSCSGYGAGGGRGRGSSSNESSGASHRARGGAGGKGGSGKGRSSGGGNMDSHSSCGANNNNVKHDKSAKRFTLDLGNNQQARIDYRSIGHNKVDLYHSEVPAELRGRGIGKALAKGALEQLARDKVKARLSCSYLSHYAEHCGSPELQRVVEK